MKTVKKRPLCGRCVRRFGLVQRGEGDGDGGADADLALKLNGCAEGFSGVLYNRETESRPDNLLVPAAVNSIKPLEHA